VQKLKKKYGPTLEDVIRAGENAARELELLESSGENTARLEKERAATVKLRDATAAKLAQARAKVAEPLARKIQKELRELGFAKAGFSIQLSPRPEPGPTGTDAAEFIFTPNEGESPRPLRAIASSGEMARVMLAIKTTLAEVDEVPVLVFDEIDANVGGETATVVGKKLRDLGKSHQVICITHLPQVAAGGQTHFAVAKVMENKRTVVALSEINGKERVAEIARMLGGQTDKSLALAKSLLG
jgi:DNA repair protein RecN (Recombination protein N)